MSTDPRVLALREAFDSAFANPVSVDPPTRQHLLLVRVDDAPYALRAADIVALAHDRKLVTVPSGMPMLLGLCGFRGDTLPVFSLATLLGHTRRAAPWIGVCARAGEHIGLAFDKLDGYAALQSDAVHALDPRPHPHLSLTARVDDAARAVIDIPAILDLIERQQDELRRSKER